MRVQNRSRNSDSATDGLASAFRGHQRAIYRLTSIFSKTPVLSRRLSWLVTASTSVFGNDAHAATLGASRLIFGLRGEDQRALPSHVWGCRATSSFAPL